MGLISRVIVFCVLVAAASLKLVALFQERTLGPFLPWQLLVATDIEILFAVLVVTHGRQSHLRFAIAGLFGAFSLLAWFLGTVGHRSCGCTGTVAVSPYLMSILDAFLAVFVLIESQIYEFWKRLRRRNIGRELTLCIVAMFLCGSASAADVSPDHEAWLEKMRDRDSQFRQVQWIVRKTTATTYNPVIEMMKKAFNEVKHPSTSRFRDQLLKPPLEQPGPNNWAPDEVQRNPNAERSTTPPKLPDHLRPQERVTVVDWHLLCNGSQTTIEQSLISTSHPDGLVPYQRWSSDENWIRSESKENPQAIPGTFVVDDNRKLFEVIDWQRMTAEMCSGIGYSQRIQSIDSIEQIGEITQVTGTFAITPTHTADFIMKTEEGIVRDCEMILESGERVTTWQITTQGVVKGQSLPSIAQRGTWSKRTDHGEHILNNEEIQFEVIKPPTHCSPQQYHQIAMYAPEKTTTIIDRTEGRFPLPDAVNPVRISTTRRWTLIGNFIVMTILCIYLIRRRPPIDSIESKGKTNDTP